MSRVLKRFKDTYKPNSGVLVPAVQRMLLRQASEHDPNRDLAHVHPSEMAKGDWCPRSTYYRCLRAQEGLAPIKKADPGTARLQNIFAEGHAIHRKWQGWLWELGLLWGVWECQRDWCGHTFLGQSPRSCEICGGLRLKYAEVPFMSERYHIIGHADGVVIIRDEETGAVSIYLIEIKSIGIRSLMYESPALYFEYEDGNKSLDEVWRDIKRPFPSHLRQGFLYLVLAADQYEMLSNVDEIIYIYEWKPSQDVKEFRVKLNSSIVAPLLEEARGIKACLSSNLTPDRPHWAEVEHKTCASCDFKAQCWDLVVEEPVKSLKTKVVRSTSAKRRKALG